MGGAVEPTDSTTSDHDIGVNTHHRRTIALTALGCALLLAACGSSSKSPAAASNDQALGVKFATCMRDHGVPSFPDPETSAGIQIPVAPAKNPSPAFKSAMQACKYLMAAEGPPPVASASHKAAAVKLAQCMREHGVPLPGPHLPGRGLGTAVDRGPRDQPGLTSVRRRLQNMSVAVIGDPMTPPVL
jgi:hypothetical protein